MNRTALALGVVGLLAAPVAWSTGAVLERGSPISPTAHLTESGVASIATGALPSTGDGLANRSRLLAFMSKRRGCNHPGNFGQYRGVVDYRVRTKSIRSLSWEATRVSLRW